MKTILLCGLGGLVICSGWFPVAGTAFAEGEVKARVESVEIQRTIADYNRIKPLQNPRYERSSQIMKRRVTDSKNKVVGEVKDILFDRGGRVTSLFVDFDRLRLRQPVYLDYNMLDVESISSGYRLGFRDEEIETLYPALLSSIETASGGEDSEDVFAVLSLKAILGKTVIDSDGTVLGKLQDVLFDSDGAYVRSVYLNINHGMVHNKGVAVPLSILGFEEKTGQTYVVIDKAYVGPILEMAKNG